MNRRLFLIGAVLASCSVVTFAAEEPLPPAEKILDRYIEVTGGRAAHEKVKSAITTVTMLMPMNGMKATITSYVVDPDKRYILTELPGAGTIEEGSNGDVAWQKSAMMGPRLKEGEEKEVAIRSSALSKDLRWKEFYSKAETTGVETIDGKTCYKVVMTPKIGPVETRYYDKDSGLMVKLATVNKSPMGEVPLELAFSDYRADGGISSPHKMATKAAGQEMQMTVDKVEYNAQIPAEKFALPEEIQALVDKKNGVAPKAAPEKAAPVKK